MNVLPRTIAEPMRALGRIPNLGILHVFAGR